MWVFLAILSAICLGFYDICKKHSLRHNSVANVLTISLLISSAILCVPLLLSRFCPSLLINTPFYVPIVDTHTHLLILLKSCLVLSSWVCGYIALKHLPLSVVSPMQATRPMWTLIGAMILFGEELNLWQWIGVISTLSTIFIFSLTEHRTTSQHAIGAKYSYYFFLISAIMLGSASGLYDKYMLSRYDHNAIQVYYTLYQALIMVIFSLIIYMIAKKKTIAKQPSKGTTTLSFRWTWTIVGISIFLVLSDYVYMLALSNPHSLISIVSTIRRGGMVIAFAYGILILKEKNPRRKLLCLLGILAGMFFLTLGSL